MGGYSGAGCLFATDRLDRGMEHLGLGVSRWARGMVVERSLMRSFLLKVLGVEEWTNFPAVCEFSRELQSTVRLLFLAPWEVCSRRALLQVFHAFATTWRPIL